mgnify:CR=1 FL=1
MQSKYIVVKITQTALVFAVVQRVVGSEIAYVLEQVLECHLIWCIPQAKIIKWVKDFNLSMLHAKLWHLF